MNTKRTIRNVDSSFSGKGKTIMVILASDARRNCDKVLEYDRMRFLENCSNKIRQLSVVGKHSTRFHVLDHDVEDVRYYINVFIQAGYNVVREDGRTVKLPYDVLTISW